jgi:hypothetical protein
MAHVTALAQHILALEPDKDAARLSFYHYLKNLCEASEPVNSDLLNRFYCRALQFPHWQENKTQLFDEVGSILQQFQDKYRIQVSLDEVVRPKDLQVVPIENLRTVELVISRFFAKTLAQGEQFRVVQEGADRIVGLVLQRDRSLHVTVFPKVLAIREGDLTPLNLDFTLFYTPELTLYPQATQLVEVGAHASVRFRYMPDGIHGTAVRGYTFQRYAVMDGGPLHKYPALFYPLKRLEQLFVNRTTDPMYVELTGLLEKAIELIAQGHPEGAKFAEAALDRGCLALEHIFPDDRLVRSLILNLEKTLELEYTRRGLTDRGANTRRTAHPSPNLEIKDHPAPEGTFEITDAFDDPKAESWQ